VAGHAADERVADPVRELIALVEREPGDADRRHPERGRLLHAFLLAAAVQHRTGRVVHAVADHRPAVVRAPANHVQLVAALRAVLVRPQHSGFRMEREALRIAVTVAPDLGQCAVLSDERVVLWDAAVVVETQDLALVAAEILGGMILDVLHEAVRNEAFHAVADRQEQVSLAVESHAAAEVAGPIVPRLGDEDLLDVLEAIVHEARAADRGRAEVAFTGVRVAEVDDLIRFEVGMQHDVVQAALTHRSDRRHTRDRVRHLAVTDDAQLTAALRDEHVAVRQPRDAPRVDEALGDGHDAELVARRPRRLGIGDCAERERGGGAEGRDDALRRGTERRDVSPRCSSHECSSRSARPADVRVPADRMRVYAISHASAGPARLGLRSGSAPHSAGLTCGSTFIYRGIPRPAGALRPPIGAGPRKSSITTRGTMMSQVRLAAGILAAATTFGGMAVLAQEPAENMSFFVTSSNPGNGGDLGGLEG